MRTKDVKGVLQSWKDGVGILSNSRVRILSPDVHQVVLNMINGVWRIKELRVVHKIKAVDRMQGLVMLILNLGLNLNLNLNLNLDFNLGEVIDRRPHVQTEEKDSLNNRKEI